jgi:hypothetical protein
VVFGLNIGDYLGGQLPVPYKIKGAAWDLTHQHKSEQGNHKQNGDELEHSADDVFGHRESPGLSLDVVNKLYRKMGT